MSKITTAQGNLMERRHSTQCKRTVISKVVIKWTSLTLQRTMRTYGKAPGCKEYHTAHQLAKKCRKKGYDSKEGLKFYQTRSNAIILQGALPANCIVRAERLKNGEKLCERQYLTLCPPPKISLRHDHDWTRGNDELVSTFEQQPAKPTQSKPKPMKIVDFSVSGIPDEAVKRSENFHNLQLIRRITRHPQKQAVQNDLDKEQSFNAFSDESKRAIMEAGNIEISEIVNVEPKWQCKVCFNHCSTGVINCACGRLMTKDSAENRKYISAIFDTFCRGNKPCTSYSRTNGHVKLRTNGYGIAYIFTHNNITLEYNAMNNKNTVAHMDVHNTQY